MVLPRLLQWRREFATACRRRCYVRPVTVLHAGRRQRLLQWWWRFATSGGDTCYHSGDALLRATSALATMAATLCCKRRGACYHGCAALLPRVGGAATTAVTLCCKRRATGGRRCYHGWAALLPRVDGAASACPRRTANRVPMATATGTTRARTCRVAAAGPRRSWTAGLRPALAGAGGGQGHHGDGDPTLAGAGGVQGPHGDGDGVREQKDVRG